MPEDFPKGSVGGIESIIFDDQLLFFGFDYHSDLIISPLFTDATMMSEYAAQNMEQTDGHHDTKYWLELVEYATTDSELVSDESSRTFSTVELNEISYRLQTIQETNQPNSDLKIEYHLLYLLTCCAHPDVSQLFALAESKNLDLYEWESIVEIARGEAPPPEGITISDVATLFREYLQAHVTSLPGNWADYFQTLV